MKTITEMLTIDYERATEKNPSGIARIIIYGLVFNPPSHYRAFECGLEPVEREAMIVFFAKIQDQVKAGLIQKLQAQNETEPIAENHIHIFVGGIGCLHESTGIVAADGTTIINEDIKAAKVTGVVIGVSPKPFEFEGMLQAPELAELKQVLLPIETKIASQCQILNDRPHFVPPIAIRDEVIQ
jgi:hypothetical protein